MAGSVSALTQMALRFRPLPADAGTDSRPLSPAFADGGSLLGVSLCAGALGVGSCAPVALEAGATGSEAGGRKSTGDADSPIKVRDRSGLRHTPCSLVSEIMGARAEGDAAVDDGAASEGGGALGDKAWGGTGIPISVFDRNELNDCRCEPKPLEGSPAGGVWVELRPATLGRTECSTALDDDRSGSGAVTQLESRDSASGAAGI
jgi:hypothetical protein